MAKTLTEEQKANLVAKAREAQSRAYAPYSDFPVGAAILTDTGEIVLGCNVENASYGLTICAERTAMCSCVAEKKGAMIAIAVVGEHNDPLTPCGMCRQFLAEFNPEAIVICEGKSGRRLEMLVGDFLPHRFKPSDLETKC